MWRWRLSERGVFAWTEYFALRRDLLLPTVAKVGKSTGRNLRFLHLPARYAAYGAELYNNSSFAVEIKMDATAA